jgi:hypothetical protein
LRSDETRQNAAVRAVSTTRKKASATGMEGMNGVSASVAFPGVFGILVERRGNTGRKRLLNDRRKTRG